MFASEGSTSPTSPRSPLLGRARARRCEAIVMECSLLGWLNLIVLTATGASIVWYTIETYKLRREAQTQTELQIRPFLSLVFEISDRSLLLYNFGRGVARTIRVQDTSLSP